jgi:hypothetical protein
VSIASRQSDLAFVLADSGVPVTLGGASTFALVRAADEEVLRMAGSPVGLVGRAILVKLAQDTLPGLSSDATITVGQGPLVGTYKVDRVLDVADGASTHFIAYPTTAQAAPGTWSQGAILLPWARREVGAAPGPAFDLRTIAGVPVLVLEVDAAEAGTDPVLNVKLQDCATVDGTYVDTGLAFTALDEDGGVRVLVPDPAVIEPFVRLVPVITGTSSPAFRGGAVVLDVAVPR